MNPFKVFTTPEYLFRPRQVLARFGKTRRRAAAEFQEVTLPWGDRIRVRPNEVIGSNIWYYGIFDLPVAEAICRLADKGETALDVGANIGQMTLLISAKVAKEGKVLAFEPQPDLFAELSHNVSCLGPRGANVRLHNVAVSDRQGSAMFDVGPCWTVNRGMGRLVSPGSGDEQQFQRVRTVMLDDVLASGEDIGVCKIDIEGHELTAFKGASQLLSRQRLRDILFEDLNPYPNELHRYLGSLGFTVFALRRKLRGVSLEPAGAGTAFDPKSVGANYLATLDPARAIQRFKSSGWNALRRINAAALHGSSLDD